MQREFGRWVRVTTWETPRGPSRLHWAETKEKSYPCLSVRIAMSVGDGDKGGISRVLVGLKVLFGVVT